MESIISFNEIPKDVKDIIWRLTDCEHSFTLQYVCKEWSTRVWNCREVWDHVVNDDEAADSARRYPPLAKMPNLKQLNFNVFDWNSTKEDHRNYVCSSVASMTKLTDLELCFVDHNEMRAPEFLLILLESLKLAGTLPRLRSFKVSASRASQEWRNTSKDTQETFVTLICQEMKQIRHLELPADFISKNMVPSFITEVSRNLKHLEYLGASFVGFEDDWRELSALERLRNLAFDLDCRSFFGDGGPARRISQLIDGGLIFANLLTIDGSSWIAHCIYSGWGPADPKAVMTLLDHYHEKGIDIRPKDAESIISAPLNRRWTDGEVKATDILYHPVVLKWARTRCLFLRSPDPWYSIIGLIMRNSRSDYVSTWETRSESMRTLLHHFFSNDTLESLSTYLQHMAGVITHCTFVLDLKDRTEGGFEGRPANVPNLCQMCLDRFPNIVQMFPRLFPPLFVCNTALAVDLYHKSTPAMQQKFLCGSGDASVLDFLALSPVIPDPAEYSGLDEMLRLGIAQVNEGLFDFYGSRDLSPMARAISRARVDVVKFLLSNGYQLRHHVDCIPSAFTNLITACTSVEDFEYLISLFDVDKTTRIDPSYFVSHADPKKLELLEIAVKRGFSFDIPVENVISYDELEWLKLVPSDVYQNRSIQELLDEALRSSAPRCLRWLVVEKGADLYASEILVDVLPNAKIEFITALCQCGFDFTREAPVSSSKLELGGIIAGSRASYFSHFVASEEMSNYHIQILNLILIHSSVTAALFPPVVFRSTDARIMLFSEPHFSKFFSQLDVSVLNRPFDTIYPSLLTFLVERFPMEASRRIIPLLKLRQDWDLLATVQGRNFIDSLVSCVSPDTVVHDFEPVIRGLYPHCAPYFFVSLCRRAENKLIQWKNLQPLFDFVNERFPGEIRTLRAKGHTAFMHAAISERLEFVKPLYETGFFKIVDEEASTTALICAVQSTQWDSLDWALETAAYLLERCTESDINYADPKGQTALAAAAASGRLKLVNLLTAAGASLMPSRDPGALFLTLSNCINSLEILRTLLESLSTDVELRTSALNHIDSSGRTLLMKACFLDVLKVLLDFGADVELERKLSSTPLIEAAKRGSVEMCSELLRRGAHLSSKDSEGKRAVDYARSETLQQMLTPAGEQPSSLQSSFSWASNLGSATSTSVSTRKHVSNTGGSLLQRKRAQKAEDDDEALFFEAPKSGDRTSAAKSNPAPTFTFAAASGFSFGATQTSTSSTSQTAVEPSASSTSSTTTTTQKTKSFSGFGGFNLNL